MSRRRAQGPSVSFFAFQDIITSVVGIFVLITLIMMLDLVQRTGSSSASQQLVADTFSAAIADLEMQLEQIEKRSKELDVLASKIGAVQVFNKDDVEKELRASIQRLNEQIERTEQRNRETQQLVDNQTKVQTELQIESQKRSPDRDELAKLLKELEKLDSKIGELELDEPLVFKSQPLNGRSVVVIEVTSVGAVVLDLQADRRSTMRAQNLERDFESWVKSHAKGSFHYFLLIRPGGATNFDTLRAILVKDSASYGYDVLDQETSVKLRSEVLK